MEDRAGQCSSSNRTRDCQCEVWKGKVKQKKRHGSVGSFNVTTLLGSNGTLMIMYPPTRKSPRCQVVCVWMGGRMNGRTRLMPVLSLPFPLVSLWIT